MPITQDQLRSLAGGGGNVVSSAGEKIGGIGQIYLDDATGEPDFVTVKSGLFGSAQSFVPLQGAEARGDDVVVAYDKDTVKGAPRVDDDGSIAPEEEQQLFAYYGIRGRATTGPVDGLDTNGYDSTSRSGTDHVPEDADDPAELNDDRPDLAGQPGIVGRDLTGPTTDDAMTRSEERVRVGTQSRERGRARLRKYIVTENVSQTVPVSREQARVVREPITDANAGAALAGPGLSEEEHEVVLHQDVPVVQKVTVPVERVRLDTDTVTEQVQVTEQVRKEQIETEVDERSGR